MNPGWEITQTLSFTTIPSLAPFQTKLPRLARRTVLPLRKSSSSAFLSNISLSTTFIYLNRIGIAIGPRIWFGPQYGWNMSQNGTVYDNRFTGAFGFGMAISSATNFTVQDNILVGNTSFIGANGPNCTTTEYMPSPAAFVFDTNNTKNMNVQSDFEIVPTADGLTCVMPPQGGDFWPFGGNPANSSGSSSSQSSGGSGSHGSGRSAGAKAGIAIGVILGVVVFFVGTFYLRRWIVQYLANKRLYGDSKRNVPPGYGRSMEQLPSGL
jgi:hypothetical protein